LSERLAHRAEHGGLSSLNSHGDFEMMLALKLSFGASTAETAWLLWSRNVIRGREPVARYAPNHNGGVTNGQRVLVHYPPEGV
jgi:hypothetical protein